MINLKQKKDWLNTELVLSTPRGVQYYPRNKSSMNEYIIVEGPGNCYGGYSLSAEENYLSYKRYQFPVITSVREWQNIITHNQAKLTYRPVQTFDNWSTDSEIRFYPNHQFIILLQGDKNKLPENIIIDNIPKEQISEDIVTLTPVDWQTNAIWCGWTWNGEQHYIYIHHEEEIVKHLCVLNKADISKFTTKYFGKLDSDLYKGRIENLKAGQVPEWKWHSQNQANRILDFDKHKAKYSYATKKLGHNIQRAYDLPMFIGAPDAPTTTARNRTEVVVQLLQPALTEWENGDPDTMYWYRYNDYICAIASKTNSRTGWGHGSGTRRILAYNIKTKKRLYAEQDSRGVWTFPVPSCKYIYESMSIELGKPLGYITRSGSGVTKSIIKDGLDVRQLFDGTNIAWFLDHAEENKVYFQLVSRWNSNESSDPYNTTPTKQLFKNDYIDVLAILMLCTTGTPVLEQFLKSNLFNLYFIGIEDLIINDRFTFVPKNKFEKNLRSWNYNRSLIYDEQGKNLKQMFGLPINFLRLLDKALEIQHKFETEEYGPNKGKIITKYYRSKFTLGNLKQAFGDTIYGLDQKSLELILEIANEEKAQEKIKNEKSSQYIGGSYYGNSRNIWQQATTLFEILPECTIKQKLIYLQRYQPTIYLLADYLNMRNTIKELQAQSPETPGIFSESMWPTKITAAKKFIPYTESERQECWSTINRHYYGNGLRAEQIKRKIFSTHPQVVYYNYKYFMDVGDTEWSPNVIECFDADGNHSGVLLALNPAAHLHYLHEQLTFWFNFYKDANQKKLFKSAVKRVKELEWVDESAGLEIVAPTCVEDLQREGTELSHCVSSFVQPIIKGTTNVMFVRRSDMRNTPYYTVEIVDGQVRQVHCYRDGGLDAAAQHKAFVGSGSPVYNKTFDILGFLKRWARNSHGAVSESSVKGSYGSLCAAR